jgi:hypothetical protein
LGFLLKVKREAGGENAALALRPTSAEETTSSPAAASPVTLVEIPSAPDETRARAAEEKRIADLEARVKAAEAEARAAKAEAAKPPVPPPPVAEAEAGVPEDAAHPLRAARERLEPAKKSTHRLSKEDFQFALDEAERVLRAHPLNPEAKYLETYARGGLAYVGGKDGVASAALVEAFTKLQRGRKAASRPAGNLLLRPDGTIRQPTPWELALGYGDARGEAMGLIEKELSDNPRNVRARKARVLLRRMQGLGG